MRKTLHVAMLIAALANASSASATKATHKMSPRMPTSETHQADGSGVLGFRCYTNNPSCSGYAPFGGAQAWSIRILYNFGRGGHKNFTTDPGQVVREPVRYNDIYQYAPGHVVIPTNAPSWFIGVE